MSSKSNFNTDTSESIRHSPSRDSFESPAPPPVPNITPRQSYRSYVETELSNPDGQSEQKRYRVMAMQEDYMRPNSRNTSFVDSVFDTSSNEDDSQDDNDTEKPDDDQEKMSLADGYQQQQQPVEIKSDLVELAFQSLKQECTSLKQELDEERRKAILLRPRYDYLESHFREYVRKREEYRRLSEKLEATVQSRSKSNQAVVAIRSDSNTKETQTWKGIICSYCSKTYEIANNKTFKDFVDWQTKNTFCVSRSTFQELQERFDKVKTAIAEREIVYENRNERAQIIALKGETDALKAQVAQLTRKNKHGQNCLDTLQRIIIKILADGQDPAIEQINEREQHWIQRILSKASELMANGEVVSTTPSALDFSRPVRTRSYTYSNWDYKSAAGDF